MFGIVHFEAFLLACILLNLIPGPDTFYVLGRSLSQGKRIGVASALGISGGALCHTFAAAIGLSAIITASQTAFMAVKFIGAGYLIYLGTKMLLSKPVSMGNPNSFGRSSGVAAFKQGLLTNVLNPKVALFFLAFLPQFIEPNTSSYFLSFMFLGCVFVTTSTIWCVGLAWLSGLASAHLKQNSKIMAYITKGTGVLLAGLGLRLALVSDD